MQILEILRCWAADADTMSRLAGGQIETVMGPSPAWGGGLSES